MPGSLVLPTENYIEKLIDRCCLREESLNYFQFEVFSIHNGILIMKTDDGIFKILLVCVLALGVGYISIIVFEAFTNKVFVDEIVSDLHMSLVEGRVEDAGKVLDRMYSAQQDLDNAPEDARVVFVVACDDFNEALQSLEIAIQTSEDRKLLERIREKFESYRKHGDRVSELPEEDGSPEVAGSIETRNSGNELLSIRELLAEIEANNAIEPDQLLERVEKTDILQILGKLIIIIVLLLISIKMIVRIRKDMLPEKESLENPAVADK